MRREKAHGQRHQQGEARQWIGDGDAGRVRTNTTGEDVAREQKIEDVVGRRAERRAQGRAHVQGGRGGRRRRETGGREAARFRHGANIL